MGHVIRMWSAVCLGVLQSQFNEVARAHLCMDKWNPPTPVHRQLSLTQVVQSKLVPACLVLAMGMKDGAYRYSHGTPCFIYNLSTEMLRCLVWQGCLKVSMQLAQIDLVSLGKHLRTHIKDHAAWIYGKPKRALLLSAKLSWLDP